MHKKANGWVAGDYKVTVFSRSRIHIAKVTVTSRSRIHIAKVTVTSLSRIRIEKGVR